MISGFFAVVLIAVVRTLGCFLGCTYIFLHGNKMFETSLFVHCLPFTLFPYTKGTFGVEYGKLSLLWEKVSSYTCNTSHISYVMLSMFWGCHAEHAFSIGSTYVNSID